MLTKKEIEVLELVKKRMKVMDIAKKLKKTQPAVSVLKNKAYKKYRESHKIIRKFEEMGIEIEEDEF